MKIEVPLSVIFFHLVHLNFHTVKILIASAKILWPTLNILFWTKIDNESWM